MYRNSVDRLLTAEHLLQAFIKCNPNLSTMGYRVQCAVEHSQSSLHEAVQQQRVLYDHGTRIFHAMVMYRSFYKCLDCVCAVVDVLGRHRLARRHQ